MDLDGIQANIEQYNAQLKQASAALTLSPDNEELQQLVASLQELIKLTEQQCQEQQQNQQSSRKSDVALSTDLDNELALFKEEIATVERQQRKGGADSSDSDPPSPPDGSTDARRQHTDQIKLSLQSLMGSRCSAPFTQSWGQLEYHPAVIEALDEASLESAASSADVKLRVLFSHPTQRVMQPCRYYLRHSCDYGEAGLDCRFSHGHVVSVADIREYSEPVGQLVASSPVLVRRDDESGLWQRATVQSVDADTEQATVRVTGHRQPRQVALSELVPLPAAEHCPSSSSDLDSSSDSEGDTPAAGVSDPEPDLDPEQVEFCPRVTWETMTCTDQLGSWEKYTKGIGSRLMQQMGYVVGSGLGLRADGRVQPVEARVYPAGRSLDHCMALREGSAAAGGAPLLSVERHLERQQRRQEKLGQREYQRDRQHNAMFDVINRVMGAGSEEPQPAARPTPVREASRHELNQRDLRVGEEIRTAERLVRRLEAGCRRQHGSAAAAALQAQLQQQQTHLAQLRRAEAGIHSEQRQRSDTRRLHLF